MQELEAGLEQVRKSPADAGVLELIVRRPAVEEVATSCSRENSIWSWDSSGITGKSAGAIERRMGPRIRRSSLRS